MALAIMTALNNQRRHNECVLVYNKRHTVFPCKLVGQLQYLRHVMLAVMAEQAVACPAVVARAFRLYAAFAPAGFHLRPGPVDILLAVFARFHFIAQQRFPAFGENADHACAVLAHAEIAPVAAGWAWMVKSIRVLGLAKKNFY